MSSLSFPLPLKNSMKLTFGLPTPILNPKPRKPRNPGIPKGGPSAPTPVWAGITNMAQARGFLSSMGTSSTDANSVGGHDNNVTYYTNTEFWNGASWAAGGALVISRGRHCGNGTTSTGWVTCGANNVGFVTTTNTYNGTVWTSLAVQPANRTSINTTGGGTSSSALSWTGFNASTQSTTFSFDGATWSAGGGYPIAIMQGTGLGSSSTDCLSTAGQNNGGVRQTAAYRYNGSTWSVTGSLNTARDCASGLGTTTLAQIIGGFNTSGTTLQTTEVYSSGVWFNRNNINTARAQSAAIGVVTSGLVMGGMNSGNSPTATAEKCT